MRPARGSRFPSPCSPGEAEGRNECADFRALATSRSRRPISENYEVPPNRRVFGRLLVRDIHSKWISEPRRYPPAAWRDHAAGEGEAESACPSAMSWYFFSSFKPLLTRRSLTLRQSMSRSVFMAFSGDPVWRFGDLEADCELKIVKSFN